MNLNIRLEKTENDLRKLIVSQKRAGVSIPLSSIVTQHSLDCGDIYSLQVLSKWTRSCGLSIIQILPLNDSGFGKSPYSSISAYAMDPLYISLYLLDLDKESKKIERGLKFDLNSTRQKKLAILKKHFLSIFNSHLTNQIKEFTKQYPFFRTYSCFKILYEKNYGKLWTEWQFGSVHSIQIEDQIETENQTEYFFQAWIQMILCKQLRETKSVLEQDGIFLMGDMPILTSINSADVWSKRHLFNRNLSAGAPPDQFSYDGQNWGFPVIEWTMMKKENYSWWRERVQYLEKFFDLYRIDHVLGMYRIWSVPLNAKSARYGYFYPQKGLSKEDFLSVKLEPDEFVQKEILYEFAFNQYVFCWDFASLPNFMSLDEDIKNQLITLSAKNSSFDESIWKENGETILNFLSKESKMLACAEDLGAVPDFIKDSIKQNEIIGLDIIRWTRNYHSEKANFILAEDYRRLSVASLSVHDTSVALAWWNEIDSNTKEQFLELIGLKEEESKDKVKLLEKMMEFALSVNSIFSIHLLHDYLFDPQYNQYKDRKLCILDNPEEHRINTPGTQEEFNWDYRFPFVLEELLDNEKLCARIKKMIKQNSR